jgi:hypothetical protein
MPHLLWYNNGGVYQARRKETVMDKSPFNTTQFEIGAMTKWAPITLDKIGATAAKIFSNAQQPSTRAFDRRDGRIRTTVYGLLMILGLLAGWLTVQLVEESLWLLLGLYVAGGVMSRLFRFSFRLRGSFITAEILDMPVLWITVVVAAALLAPYMTLPGAIALVAGVVLLVIFRSFRNNL